MDVKVRKVVGGESVLWFLSRLRDPTNVYFSGNPTALRFFLSRKPQGVNSVVIPVFAANLYGPNPVYVKKVFCFTHPGFTERLG